MPPPRVNFTAGPIVPTSSVGTRNIEVLSDYFLGKDPALKETLAANSLRLIGIDGRCFVLRSELISRLNELREYVNDEDAILAKQIQDVIDDLSAEENARIHEDENINNRINGVNDRVTNLEAWQSAWEDPSEYVLVDDLIATLTNYYTKQEVDSLIAAIPTLTYEVVQELPTTNISARTIYLVSNESAGEDHDFYYEYIYVGDTSLPYDPDNWELIGTTKIDLTDYYTKTEVDSLLNNKQDALTAGNNISISNDTIGVTGDVIKVLDNNVYIKNIAKGIYRVRANHSISYSDLASATPLTYAYDVYLVVVEDSRSRKTFYIVSGNYVVAAGYSREVVTSWVGDVVTIDTSKIQSTANLVTTVSSSSTNANYPSAKAVYDFVNEEVTSISSQEVEEIFTL